MAESEADAPPPPPPPSLPPAPAAAPPVKEQNVRVAVRVRPMVAKEKLENQASCLRVHNAERQIVIGKDRAFTFDFVFGQDSTQKQVYDEACSPLLTGCMQNATIFGYGHGSGKTFTMGSGPESANDSADAAARGVIPRVVDERTRLASPCATRPTPLCASLTSRFTMRRFGTCCTAHRIQVDLDSRRCCRRNLCHGCAAATRV